MEKAFECGSKRCKVCEVINPTRTFSNKEDDRTFHIKGGKLNCNSQNIVYLVQHKTCDMQYFGSTSTKFRLRFINYKNCYRNYNSNKQVQQAAFNAHFDKEDHNDIQDWKFTLIYQARDVDSVRRSEAFWQHTLDTFHPG